MIISIILIIFILFSSALAIYAVRGTRFTMAETEAFECENYPEGATLIGKGEPYTIIGYEGYVLHAEHHKSPNGDGKHFVILTHGHRSSRHGVLKYMPTYLRRGYDCVIYDLRGHGENLYQGKSKKPLRLGRRQICTFSRKESLDLMKVIEDTRNRFGKDILLGLHGESLGAATTVATLGHKPDVAFAVEDCGFADIVNVQKVGLKFLHIPQFMVYPASVMSVLINGYSFTSTRPVDAVADNEVPLLVIHGEADDFILLDNAKRIYDAQKGFKRMETFPGAGHAGSLGSDPIRYEKIVNEFLDSIGC